MRDIPCLHPDGQISARVEVRESALFEVACVLLLFELRANGWGHCADLLEGEYMSTRRKMRWGGCYFPPLVPNHNAGTESINARVAKDVAAFRLCFVVVFLVKLMNHLNEVANRRQRPGEGFSPTIKRLETDLGLFRKVNKLVSEVTRRRTGYIVDDVARYQMHATRAKFGRATRDCWIIPSSHLLTALLETHYGEIADVKAELQDLRAAHLRLLRDPEKFESEVKPTINEYLRLAVRSFYVLERLDEEDVRSKYSQYSCSCPYHRLRSYCKHSVSLTLIMQLVRLPPLLNMAVLQRRAKRGRPKTKTATVPLGHFNDNCNISSTPPKDMEPDVNEWANSGSEGEEDDADFLPPGE
jgi:hypothetical protein